MAADLDLFLTGKSLLQEVSRQVTECFANSVCNYSTEENIPLRDALLINFLADTDDESAMQELEAKDIPLADEPCVSASARFDIYATDHSGRLQMLADYKKCLPAGEREKIHGHSRQAFDGSRPGRLEAMEKKEPGHERNRFFEEWIPC